MFDFYFGTEDEIKQNEEGYLLFVKRMIPLYFNSIPDSEFIAIHNLLKTELDQDINRPVLVETGVGASTIVLLYYAMKNNGVLYTWDMNPLKGSFLKSVFMDTLVPHFGKNLSDHWKFITYNSNSEHLGIPVLKEFDEKVDFCFLDSEHTQNTLMSEVRHVNQFLKDGSVVSIDDAYYKFIHTNMGFVNMTRKKLGLGPVENPKDNQGNPFYEEVEKFLKENWASVEMIDNNSFKKEWQNDIYWKYYDSNLKARSKVNMEDVEALEHRFDSWKVSNRLS